MYELTWVLYQGTRSRLRNLATDSRTQLLFKGIKYFLYGWLLFFIVNLIVVFLRERYQL